MPTPINIQVPANTTAIYITAISLSPSPSEVSVSWSPAGQSATHGTTFVGPNPTHVLGDKVFSSPVTVVDNKPEILSIKFDFKDTTCTVEEPVSRSAGPAGSQTVVHVSGYASGDEQKRYPTTVTLVMKRPMAGIITI